MLLVSNSDWGQLLDSNNTIYRALNSWQPLILDSKDGGREEGVCVEECEPAGNSPPHWTRQHDNIPSAILSDTRHPSSPIINPGWAPAQVALERRRSHCQLVWHARTPSTPWACEGDSLTLATSHAWRIQQKFRQHSLLRNSLADRLLNTRNKILHTGSRSEPSKYNSQRTSPHKAVAPRWVLLRRIHRSPYPIVANQNFDMIISVIYCDNNKIYDTFNSILWPQIFHSNMWWCSCYAWP